MEKMISDYKVINKKKVDEAKADMPDEAELDYLSELFKILSDPTRMKLVFALTYREMCVCDLAATLGMTKSAISHQLKTMKQCSVVKPRREGKNVFYSLHDQHITDIIAMAASHASHIHPKRTMDKPLI